MESTPSRKRPPSPSSEGRCDLPPPLRSRGETPPYRPLEAPVTQDPFEALESLFHEYVETNGAPESPELREHLCFLAKQVDAETMIMKLWSFNENRAGFALWVKSCGLTIVPDSVEEGLTRQIAAAQRFLNEGRVPRTHGSSKQVFGEQKLLKKAVQHSMHLPEGDDLGGYLLILAHDEISLADFYLWNYLESTAAMVCSPCPDINARLKRVVQALVRSGRYSPIQRFVRGLVDHAPVELVQEAAQCAIGCMYPARMLPMAATALGTRIVAVTKALIGFKVTEVTDQWRLLFSTILGNMAKQMWDNNKNYTKILKFNTFAHEDLNIVLWVIDHSHVLELPFMMDEPNRCFPVSPDHQFASFVHAFYDRAEDAHLLFPLLLDLSKPRDSATSDLPTRLIGSLMHPNLLKELPLESRRHLFRAAARAEARVVRDMTEFMDRATPAMWFTYVSFNPANHTTPTDRMRKWYEEAGIARTDFWKSFRNRRWQVHPTPS